MFPFHQRGELSFQISNYLENTSNSNSNSSNNDNNNYNNNNNNNNNNTSNIVCFDPTRVEQNESAPATAHLHPVVVQHGRPASNGARRGRPRRPPPSIEVSNNNGDQVGNDVSQKRIVHREIERQRRQEMANLFSSLRSLLPMEYIRGKRSTCDHISEAARYIKDLENNINDLRQRKERLKGLCSSSRNNLHRDAGCSSSCTSYRSDCNVNIHTFPGAIDIDISARVGEEDVFPLSRVLHALIQEGLSVVDCTSSRVNQRWIYAIHCEVSGEISIDSSELQQRLMSEIVSSDDP